MIHKVLSLIAVILVVLTGCATTPAVAPTTAAKATSTTAPKSAAETPRPGAATVATPKPASTGPSGTLTSAISSFGDDVPEPILASAGQLPAPIFETVVAVDEKANLVPRLAESWSVSAEGKSWTIKVRKGVKFHNGEELTSADLKFSLERLISAKARSAWSPVYRNSVASVDAPDAYTVVVNTKAIDAPFMTTATGWIVVPKKYVEERGDDYSAKNPIGTGPFRFVKHVPGSSIEYEAVKDHWRITPAFEKVVVKLIPEESTRMAMLKRGELDIAEVSIDSVDEVKAGGLELRYGSWDTVPLIAFKGTWLDTGQPVMDVKVRQALTLAINREELAKTFFKGLATPGGRFFMGSSSWGWNPSWKADPYDPQKARQLLAEAGYPGKFRDPVINIYSFKAAGAGWLPQLTEIVSGYWEAVGVKTKLTAIDYATLWSMAFAPQPDPKIVGAAFPWAGTAVPLNQYYAWNGYGSTSLWGLMNDKEWDAAFAKMAQELDEGKRVQMYRELLVQAHDKYVDLNTVSVKLTYAVNNKIGEWRALMPNSLGAAYEGIQHR